MIRTPLLAVIILISTGLFAQFSDGFDNYPDLYQSDWMGDIDAFTINELEQLQLMASEPSTVKLYRKTNIPDSVEWLIFFKMDFSPSNNNKLRIYLHTDTFDLNQASGYCLEIGENGSDDRLKFIRLIEGNEIVLAEGNLGSFSEEPVEAFLKIRRNKNGFWSVYSKRNKEDVYHLEFELLDSTIELHSNQYFLLSCSFTSTRKDKFFFDDISVAEIVTDDQSPVLLEGKLIDSKTVQLLFDEIIDKGSALKNTNYTLKNPTKNPSIIIFDEDKPNKILLGFDTDFKSNTIYGLEVNNLSDIYGNSMKNPEYFEFYLTEKPDSNDLIINEILFNPYDGGKDFVEIMNVSGKILNLNGLTIANKSKASDDVRFSRDFEIFPGELICITEDTLNLSSYYKMPDTANLIENKLPGFNNDSGNVSLYFESDSIFKIDSFDYDETMHFPLIQNKEGISLERIHSGSATNSVFNWQSASSLTGGATPGYRNSQNLSSTEVSDNYFNMSQKVFSPDNDGYFDNLVLQYHLPKEAYVASILVFDAGGNFIRTLLNNELLGTEGIIRWDGLDENGYIAPIGMYILHFNLFHASGDVFQQKKVCVLASKL